MAGQRSINGDGRCLVITNLTQHHHIWCLTQHRPEGVGERQINRCSHLHLIDTLKHILDRILHGDDFSIRLVDVVQAGVQSGGFPRACRACH